MALDYDELYKIVLVGDAAVGKTNLLAYYTAQDKRLRVDGTVPSFSDNRKATVGVEFATTIVTHPDGTRIKAQIWDTAGQERYRAITASHYKRAAGALLVFDVTNRKTFENAKNVWLKEVTNSAESDGHLMECVMLVGNKIDLTQATVVNEAEQQSALSSLGLPMMARTSARSGAGVDNAFEKLILRVYEVDQSKRKNKAGKLSPTATREGVTTLKPANPERKDNNDCC